METVKDDDYLDWENTQPFTTSWATQKSRKPKTYGSYGSRGGTNSRSSRRQRTNSICISDKQQQQQPGIDEESEGYDSAHNSWNSDAEYDRRSGSSSSFGSDAAAATAATVSMASSSSTSSRREMPPLRPSKKNHRRSISASIPPKIPRPNALQRRSTTSHSSSTSSITAVLQGYDEENAHPNELNEIGEAPSPPQFGRKKLRVRRASISNMASIVGGAQLRRGNSVPVFDPSRSMSNMSGVANMSPDPAILSRRNSMPNLDNSDLQWLQQGGGGAIGQSMNSPRLSRYDSGELTDATANSPSGQSISASTVSSSRKRGMSDDPSEGCDDMSLAGTFSAPRTSLHSKSASRACKVLSPGFASHGSRQGSTLTYTTVKIADENEFVGTGRAMTLDSESEDESEEDISVASSMEDDEDTDDGFSPFKEVARIKPVKTKDDVIETMPSYNDLKYLTQELKKEKKKHDKRMGAYASLNYTVKLPQGWPSERRGAFLTWASQGLGFSLRAANASQSYLVAPPAKGKDTYKLVYDAIVMLKNQEMNGPLSSPCAEHSNQEAPIILDASSDFATAPKKQRGASSTQHIIADFSTESADSVLIEGMSGLSFNDKDPSLLRRHVTVDNTAPNQRFTKLHLDLSPQLETARPSMDSHVGANNDFMFHMHGLSPAAPPRRPIRPPKLSLGSVSSNVSMTRQKIVNTGMNTGSSSCLSTSCQQFEFVATPLMKQFQGWGSQPVAGKDWGDSQRCSESIATAMIKNFNSALHEAGLYDSKEDAMDEFTAMQTRRSADLCLDLEADSCDEDESDDDVYFCDAGARRSIECTPTVVDHRVDTGTPSFDAMGALPSAEKLREIRRRNVSLAKHRRMSVCVTSTSSSAIYQRKLLFAKNRQSYAPLPSTRTLSTMANSFSNQSFHLPGESLEPLDSEQPLMDLLAKKNVLPQIFSFLEGPELLTNVSLVCKSWADASTDAFAELMVASVGCSQDDESDDDYDEDSSVVLDDPDIENDVEAENSIALSMQRSWNYLLTNFPHASFLSEGAFKRVYKVKNAAMKAPEAISIMDVDKIESTGNKSVVATELAVSVMLSSLSRRGICPNFVVTRGVFTCPFEPPASHWGCAENKNHQVHANTPKAKRPPKQPSAKHAGRFQFIRMELCTEGDAEEFIKDQPNELLPIEMSRILLFQISFALYAGATKFSLKHYDLKLLNVFLQKASNVPGAKLSATGDVVLRYGLGSKNFALRMPVEKALLAKLADYGTADVKAETNGQPLSLAQITTPENTPPEFLILGDAAKQGHEHDLFGLGLCMLHLFTGSAPYEEILEDVQCPPTFKKMLSDLWEDESVAGYSVIRSFVMSEVYTDDDGNITEGEADETFYDTLYKFLVLFGVPENKFQRRQHGRVWKAVSDCFGCPMSKRGKDSTYFARDQRKYSLSHGTNKYIARARRNLEKFDGGMELLRSLVDFDGSKRATALDVLNSEFFAPLTEVAGTEYRHFDDVRSYNAFAM